MIVVSCVTKEEPYKPHPHNLVGKDCKKGVCTLRIRDTNTISFPHLGIQCAKKKDVEGNLKMRQEINVDPFQSMSFYVFANGITSKFRVPHPLQKV